MKKIYLRTTVDNVRGLRIIDVDSTSFAFNTTAGKVYATSTVNAKTSDVTIIEHPLYKKMNDCERFNFQIDAMDHLAEALEHLLNNPINMMTIEFSLAETAYCKYTFKVGSWTGVYELEPPIWLMPKNDEEDF